MYYTMVQAPARRQRAVVEKYSSERYHRVAQIAVRSETVGVVFLFVVSEERVGVRLTNE